MSVDKSTAPENVVLIVATLSREGYSDMTDSLDFLSDSTAEISISQIPVGTWFLSIKAYDGNNVVRYSGESEVSVYEGNVTNVSLVLNEVNSGTGTVKIAVTWGTSSTNLWTDYSLNPVLRYTGSGYDNYGIQQPKVIYDNGVYKMWYLGLAAGSRSVVCYAESQDGLSWYRPVQNPVMTYGNAGCWDATAAVAGAVLKEDSSYKMYYVGWNNENSNWNIGLATSSDGIHWTKYPDPILQGTTGWEYQIVPSSILKIDGVYYLYYYGRNFPVAKIGLAVSFDGINFTKYSGNPILSATESWEGNGIYHPSVIKDGNVFRMVYGCVPSNAFGSATSSDGRKWNKNTANPFFKAQDTHNLWAGSDIAYPCYLKVNEQYKLFYSGYNSSPYYNIGVAVKK